MEIPDYARHVLAVIQKVVPSAVIAGGFLRDIHAGVQPKDIDIFCGPISEAQLYAAGLPFRTVFDSAYVASARDEVAKVYDLTFWFSPIPVQLVVLKREMTPAEVIGRVDFDFCEIAYTGTALIRTDAFKLAMYCARAICPFSDPVQVERSRRRAARWAPRFPGWSFEFPFASTIEETL